jgi:hypothetical protein
LLKVGPPLGEHFSLWSDADDADTLVLVTADRVYADVNASDATETLSHQNYQLTATDACGFLINDSSVLSLLDSNVSKPVYTGQAKLTPIYSGAAVCVVSHPIALLSYPHGMC